MKIFVPIKHNSQRVPRKNFRKIKGVPLYKHTLYKLAEHEVYVDTDSEEIKNGIKTDGRLSNITVLDRDKKLIGDEVSVCELIHNFLTTYGVRDGALTQAYITYEFEDYNSIQLKLEVTYNPTPILSSGYWKILDSDSIGGYIRANSLKFLGGQAEAPSLGGTFELKENFQTRFKVIVPLRPINKLEW